MTWLLWLASSWLYTNLDWGIQLRPGISHWLAAGSTSIKTGGLSLDWSSLTALAGSWLYTDLNWSTHLRLDFFHCTTVKAVQIFKIMFDSLPLPGSYYILRNTIGMQFSTKIDLYHIIVQNFWLKSQKIMTRRSYLSWRCDNLSFLKQNLKHICRMKYSNFLPERINVPKLKTK